jgi:adenosylcobalamin-dependent ribonucleoside-diphosphate reductase
LTAVGLILRGSSDWVRVLPTWNLTFEEFADMQLTNLSRRILLDRYALKTQDRQLHLQPGRLVVATANPTTGERVLGEVIYVNGRKTDIQVLDSDEILTLDKDAVDIPLETTPKEIWARVARHLASVEADPEYWEQRFYDSLEGFKFVPGGRILVWAGTDQLLTPMNCFCAETTTDSIEGVFETLAFMVETMSRGGGVGINIGSIRPACAGTRRHPKPQGKRFISVPDSRQGIVAETRRAASLLADGYVVEMDFSRLRPRFAVVKGVNGRSSGAASWMKLIVEVAEVLREVVLPGRLTLTLNGRHPDLQEVIETVVPQMQQLGINFRLVGGRPTGDQVRLEFPDRNDPSFETYNGDLDHWKGELVHYGDLDWDTYRELLSKIHTEVPTSAAPIEVTPAGAVEWGRIFSFATGLISQAGSRRGALLELMPDWHPEVIKFINYKRIAGKMTNANVSVGVSDALMKAVEEDGLWTLEYPDTQHPEYDRQWAGNLAAWKSLGLPTIVHAQLPARELWHEICHAAWSSAEPGLLFLDRVNQESPSSYYPEGWIQNCNPCAEEPLPGNGVCLLGSLNLSRFVSGSIGEAEVEWDELKQTVESAVRMLDNVVDLAFYHTEAIRKQQQRERRMGLGIMGLADMMVRAGVRYGSIEGQVFIDRVMRFIKETAYWTSVELAKEKGPFPLCEPAKHIETGFCRRLPDDLRAAILAHGIRNVTLLTVPPTGTTASLVGTSTGLEPFFNYQWERRGRLGRHIERMQVLDEYLAEHPDTGDLPDYFVTAMELTPEEHAHAQAAVQAHIDAATSKTANLPTSYSVDDVGRYYQLIYRLGAKGGTVYRDGSRDEQVLYNVEEPIAHGEKCDKCGSTNTEREGRCFTCRDCGHSKCSL